MKATLNGIILAEADRADLIYIEGNWYFPPAAIDSAVLRDSPTPYYCPWKGECTYLDISVGADWHRDNAWTYRQPLPVALDRVKKDFTGYVAFWRDVEVAE